MSTRATKIVNRWLKNVQYSLLPGTCIVCRKATGRPRDLCPGCEAALPRVARPCRQCGLPLPPASSGNLCGTCLACPPPWTRLVAPLAYHPPVPSLVAGFKYRGRLVQGRVLGDLLIETLSRRYRRSPLPDLLLPVPLHPGRVRQRGYNQSLELARWLSRDLDIAVDRRLLRRTSPTAQQAGLSAAARKANLRGAFRLGRDSVPRAGTCVAIVDDVVTTGVTVAEIARVLRRAGVAEIHVWALARTCL